jgi:AcrR family transcriptional regulator
MKKIRRPRPQTLPLKEPKQERSRATVEALMEATGRVLMQDGYERATTNRIAEVAGVNIASLYQYFPSKEALVAALIDRQLGETREAVMQAMAEAADAPPNEALRAVVAAYMRLQTRNPKFLRAVFREVPRLDRLNPVSRLRGDLIHFAHELLEARKEDLSPSVQNVERSAFICIHLVQALAEAALFERPEYLTDQGYSDDVANLVIYHLRGTL